MNLQPLTVIRGALTLIPGIDKVVPRIGIGTGGTNSAAYCYRVWMKHLCMLHRNGFRSVPDTLAELGPGDSLGIGLAAMLSGVNHYYALDVVQHFENGSNLAIFDELVRLYRQRASCPRSGFVDFSEGEGDHGFPEHILDEGRMAQALAPDRVERIRRALSGEADPAGEISIQYMVPWHDAAVMRDGSIDLLLSHSVLEHVVDLESTYAAMRRWIRPGGWMSHQIDFKCHGLSGEWNGYRGYPEPVWKLVLGNRPFLLNREPWSTHAGLLESNRFELVCVMRNHIRDRGIRREMLASRWRDLSDDDLTCAGAFVQARRPVLDALAA